MAVKTQASERPILSSKVFLYITEFFSGMAVMAAELAASRLLAPYFSSSQIVWTIIIGTIMIALALGAVFGGKWADRNPNPDLLYLRILVAAVWIALIPLVGKFIIIAVSGLLIISVSTNFLSIATFISCAILFAPPLFLLGTVTAGLNKFATDSLENNASVVGRLSACNTFGSILGTFLPTFVTIPAVGTFVTFLIFSGLILAISLIYFVSNHTKLITCAVSTVLFIGSAVCSPLTGFAFWERSLAYEGESVYNYLQVKDLPDRTILSTNVLFGVQSVAMKTNSATGMYYETALEAPRMADHTDSALIIGMGTGTYAKALREHYPNMAIQGVEIDQKITQLSGTWFNAPADIPVDTYDGRAWLQVSHKTYDVIMVDAYRDITIPFAMSTVEFFTLVREHLRPGGVMVVNMNMTEPSSSVPQHKPTINDALTATIAAVFGAQHVSTQDVPGTTNRELFAKRVASSSQQSDDLGQSAQQKVSYNETLVMTDDKAPVEVLGMQAIDAIIAQEARPYREILRTQGIQGLLNELQ